MRGLSWDVGVRLRKERGGVLNCREDRPFSIAKQQLTVCMLKWLHGIITFHDMP
jgi:hypothetical protein